MGVAGGTIHSPVDRANETNTAYRPLTATTTHYAPPALLFFIVLTEEPQLALHVSPCPSLQLCITAMHLGYGSASSPSGPPSP